MKRFLIAFLIFAAFLMGTAHGQQFQQDCMMLQDNPSLPLYGTWVKNPNCGRTFNIGWIDARVFPTLNAAQSAAALAGLQIKVFEYIPCGAPLVTSVPISIEGGGVVDTKGYALTISAPWCDSMASATPAIIGTGTVTWNVNDCGLGTVNNLTIPGSSLAVGEVYYQGPGGLALAYATGLGTLPAVCIASSASTCIYSGVFKYATSQSWTPGAAIYVSDAFPGSLMQALPGSGHYLQAVGVALASDTILIQISPIIGGVQ
jgi:hypothetical protein